MSDPARVEIVEQALDAVAMIGHTRAHAWAVAIVNALDAYDMHERVDHPRGQMTWADETEPDDPSPTSVT